MTKADSHDLIRVQGARENNLKDVSVDLPKRRLTVFTGVSGSGKSSLVFGTIAAESQRLINETYSAFVQGFLPTLGRPEVDVLEGLTTAIIVDQERMGANSRSTVGTVTDANAMLRVLVQPSRQAAHRVRTFNRPAAMPRDARDMVGDSTCPFDDSKFSTRAPPDPRLTARLRLFRSNISATNCLDSDVFLSMTNDIRVHRAVVRHESSAPARSARRRLNMARP